MTARLSLLDQPSESPWVEERSSSAVHPPILDENQLPTRDRSYPVPPAYGDANALSTPPPQPHATLYNQDTCSHQQHPQGDRERFSPENEIGTPATVSTATTGSSHVLVELNDAPSTHMQTDQDRGTPSVYSNTSESQQYSASTQNSQSGAAPPLPDRSSIPQPSRSTPYTPVSEAEAQRQQGQRSETYSIRHISWADGTGQLRDCPILAQNKNGPCPLLALVNALVLRSNQDSQPPIVRALQTREQISLGLLIEALFDELTTCLGPDRELPDIEALSRFLTMLHTGMNVNPRLALVWDSVALKAMLRR
jgi:hypothetical protein